MINKKLIYDIVLSEKIHKKNNILIVDNNLDIIFELNIKKILFSELENENLEIYDYIIFYDLFSLSETNIKNILEKIKESTLIIIINNLIINSLQYNYHPISYLQNFLYEQPAYIDNVHDLLRKYGYILDADRICDVYIPTYRMEYYCIVLEKYK